MSDTKIARGLESQSDFFILSMKKADNNNFMKSAIS